MAPTPTTLGNISHHEGRPRSDINLDKWQKYQRNFSFPGGGGGGRGIRSAVP